MTERRLIYNFTDSVTAAVRNMMSHHPDLRRITKFPDTNQDTVVAIVMRYLYIEIFTTVISERLPRLAEN